MDGFYENFFSRIDAGLLAIHLKNYFRNIHGDWKRGLYQRCIFSNWKNIFIISFSDFMIKTKVLVIEVYLSFTSRFSKYSIFYEIIVPFLTYNFSKHILDFQSNLTSSLLID